MNTTRLTLHGDIHETSERVRTHKVSPVEIVNACLERIEELNPTLNAFNPQALSPENTAFANYYGLPAISVPCGVDDHGVPIGLQIVGKPRDEEAVLILADRYQASTRSA